MISKISIFLRKIHSAPGFLYDFWRFVRYGGVGLNVADPAVRDFFIIKIYHGIEKGLSYRECRRGFARDKVRKLCKLLERSRRERADPTFHESVSISVLRQYLALNDPEGKDLSLGPVRGIVNSGWAQARFDLGGVKQIEWSADMSSVIPSPESFFGSRRSVRDFSPKAVPRDIVERAISLALRSPSVCNRQAWFTYHLDSPEVIAKALKHQSGNRGFGHEVPCLLIITSDLKAFLGAHERYQSWIDGGLFAMSLVWAFHALGLGACCLNWSRDPSEDMAFRRDCPIANHHSVIMMLAVGYPNESLKVCASERKPLDSFVRHIDPTDQGWS